MIDVRQQVEWRQCNKKGHKTRVEPTGVVNKIKCLIATCDRIWLDCWHLPD